MKNTPFHNQISELVARLVVRDKRFTTKRLVVAAGGALAVYMAWPNQLGWLVLVGVLVAFCIDVYRHGLLRKRLRHAQAMSMLLHNERTYQQGAWPEQDGAEFLEENHPYAIHLDVVGRHSLFHFLNRTVSPFGRKWLAHNLLHLGPQEQLISTQAAIKELAEEEAGAYRILGHLYVHKNHLQDQAAMDNLLRTVPALPVATRISMWVLPLVFLAGALGMAAEVPVAGTLVTYAFLLQLGLLGVHLKMLKQATAWGERAAEGLQGYAKAMEEFAEHPWKSARLKEMAHRLQEQPKALNQLKHIVQQLNSLNNAPAALVFNGSVLYHLHQFRRLDHWVKAHGTSLLPALNELGQLESWLSLAQFARNNAAYTWPEVANHLPLEAEELGHPLIAPTERVCNSISFKNMQMVVLTGSNMAGKSTFLRTLGINCILARTGAPVCASRFTAPAVDLWASMRNQDQLASRESYFYAEVKRLGTVVEAAKSGRILVLLDEVLRGTNSHDKRQGTLALIRKLHELNALGIVATHDLEVGILENELPGVENYCFEIDEVGGQLNITYRLQKGISTTTTATYLMRSMGIVD